MLPLLLLVVVLQVFLSIRFLIIYSFYNYKHLVCYISQHQAISLVEFEFFSLSLSPNLCCSLLFLYYSSLFFVFFYFLFSTISSLLFFIFFPLPSSVYFRCCCVSHYISYLFIHKIYRRLSIYLPILLYLLSISGVANPKIPTRKKVLYKKIYILKSVVLLPSFILEIFPNVENCCIF